MKKVYIVSVSVLLFLTSCGNLEDWTPDTTSSTEDHSSAQSEFDDINSLVEKSIQSIEDIPRPPHQKPNATMDTISQSVVCAIVTANRQDSIVLDFGTGCSDIYGVERSGKIMIHYTGKYKDEGAVITVALLDYVVDGVSVAGSKTVINLGYVNGNLQWEIDVDDAELEDSDGNQYSWESLRYRTLTETDSSFITLDEVYEVHGTASGVDRDGVSYEVVVNENNPLEIDIECWLTTRMPKSGIITISPEGKLDREVDYSAGGVCDRQVDLTIGENTVTLSL